MTLAELFDHISSWIDLVGSGISWAYHNMSILTLAGFLLIGWVVLQLSWIYWEEWQHKREQKERERIKLKLDRND